MTTSTRPLGSRIQPVNDMDISDVSMGLYGRPSVTVKQ